MKIIILTQEENLYLPQSFATVCRAFPDEVVCIVASPAMSTHGGAVKGFLKHFQLFGIRGTWIMACRLIIAKLKGRFAKPSSEGPFHSIKQVADGFDIPYYHVPKVREQQFQYILDKYRPDLLISISCPQIIGKKIRERIPMGCINVHGAPLPKYRGLMPAFWVLRNGETETATSVHDLMAKLDDGEILVQKKVAIDPNDTWDSLVTKTKAEGARALVEAIEQIKAGTVQRKPNREEDATYFSFPTAEDRKAFIKAGRSFF
ncbi:Bifunctional polymyxin resistance protein ArnA [Anaerohalosphaera lusitana]|uniref:Bifunctional polymyxin resistance protein ArnA n=1 Tax=Anaerohalosphaera lusitana TaxID=1936003 RepID=A0A1U9NK81_9BACT|nr:formyltransferase family protein [Anaerohalosphaera lusitana]AQT68333.1 Bifunctional polymyxin resistance protein ArnA [Anaerohalosphaera lusitana]